MATDILKCILVYEKTHNRYSKILVYGPHLYLNEHVLVLILLATAHWCVLTEDNDENQTVMLIDAIVNICI